MKRALLLLVLATSALAGQLTENVATSADKTHTYTLYLPTSYDPAKKHPLLFVLEARGRGTMAAEIFRAGAEEFGWIILSSNNTHSDNGSEINERALRALLPEANRYAVDTKRLYATGFSGTALVAWALGVNTRMLAGVIGVGGRLIEDVPPAKFNFAHFGFTGTTDFNNREMRLIDAMLEREGKVHRLEIFEGEHQWMSSQRARNAIAWMEVIATRDPKLVAREYARELEEGKTLQSLDALRHYQAMERTYETEEVRGIVRKLEDDPAIQRALQAEVEWDEFEQRYFRETLSRIPQIFAALRQEDNADVHGRLMREFKVGELQRRSKASGPEGLAARRLLATVDGQMSFYLLRQFFARREYRFAAGTLAVSNTIRPDRPFILYNLAAAHARLGHKRQAVDYLTRAVERGFQNIDQLIADEHFASVRNEPGFQRLTKNWPKIRK